MNNVIKFLLAAGVAILLASFAYKNFTNKPSDTPVARTTADPVVVSPKTDKPTAKEINPDKKLGEAGNLVRAFFKNWEYERYAEMYEQTVHSGDKSSFIFGVSESPIRWQNLEILSEDRTGNDWSVGLKVDVTDLPSAIAGCAVNVMTSPDPIPDKSAYKFSPKWFGIEQFMTMKQTWKVVNLNGRLFIDTGVNGSTVKWHENIMSYVIDSANLKVPPSGPEGLTDNEQAIVFSRWLAPIAVDMNILTKQQIEAVVSKARPLMKPAQDELLRVVRIIKHRQQIENEPDFMGNPSGSEQGTTE
jgi:hypothetical protein